MMSRVAYAASVTFAVLFLVVPLLFVLPLAFNSGSYLSYPMDGLSLKWFRVIFEGEGPWLFALENSVKVALGAMVVAVFVGGAAALGVMSSSRLTTIVVSALFVSPLVVPTVVLGVAIYFVFASLSMTGTYISLVFAHGVLGTPLVFMSVMNSLKGIDPSLDLAGASLGASSWFRLRTITLPLALPGFVFGALFAFIISFDEVVLTLFLSSPKIQTLPIELFSHLRDKLEPTLVAVALLLTLVSMCILLTWSILQKSYGKKDVNAD